MTRTGKADAVENGGTHHTIGAPRAGAAQDARSGTVEGSAETPANPGFDMAQPQDWAPRDRDQALVSAAADARPAPPSVADGGTAVPGSALSREQLEHMTDDIIAALKTVYDPEIPADIYELGLIYKIDIKDSRDVEIDMTLTAPACPVAGEMPQWVENAVRSVAGVGDVTVNLTFDPPWEASRMSDEARLALNMF